MLPGLIPLLLSNLLCTEREMVRVAPSLLNPTPKPMSFLWRSCNHTQILLGGQMLPLMNHPLTMLMTPVMVTPHLPY
jgi:hypothetical protein